MNSQLILLMLLFAYLLAKGLYWAVFEQGWSAVKINRFFLYIVINLLVPAIILGLYLEGAAAQEQGSNLGRLPSDFLVNLDFLIPTLLYGLSLVGAFLAYLSWPFAKIHKLSLRTLVLVLLAVFVVEIINYVSFTRLPIPGSLV